MGLVVDVDGLGRSEDLGNEILLVRLAGDGDVGLCEDVLEVDDLEGFPVGRGEQRGAKEEEEGRAAWTPWWWQVARSSAGLGRRGEGVTVTNRDGGGLRHLTGRGGLQLVGQCSKGSARPITYSFL